MSRNLYMSKLLNKQDKTDEVSSQAYYGMRVSSYGRKLKDQGLDLDSVFIRKNRSGGYTAYIGDTRATGSTIKEAVGFTWYKYRKKTDV